MLFEPADHGTKKHARLFAVRDGSVSELSPFAQRLRVGLRCTYS